MSETMAEPEPEPGRDLTDEELEALMNELIWYVPVQAPDARSARHLDLPGHKLTLAQAKRALGYYRSLAEKRREHVQTLLEWFDAVATELHDMKVWAGEDEDPEVEETRLFFRRCLDEDRLVRRLLGVAPSAHLGEGSKEEEADGA
jgi:hypothetical protein